MPQGPIYTQQMHLGSQLAISHPLPLSQGPASSQVTTAAIQVNDQAEATGEVDTHISVSVPLNTGVVGGTVSHVQLHFALDVDFKDFFSHVCVKMDLDPKVAEIGYKYHTDQACDPPHQLSDSEQLSEAFEHGCQLMKQACGRQVILEIHNLCKPTQAMSTSRKSLWSAAAATELPVIVDTHPGASGDTQPSTVMSFASEFCKLKERLSCAQHAGKYCYVTPTSDHDALDIYKLTSWVKSIHMSSSTSNVPAIHMHLPGLLDGSKQQESVSSSTRYLIGSVSDEEEDLTELDTMMPLLNMLQYEDNLISHGVAYVNSVLGIQEEFFVDVVGMPLGALCPFLATTHWLIHWEKKGKGRAVDDSDKENEDPSDDHTLEIC
ncbi:hypothetical protein EDD17DRAFT_1766101 [Pisolithus thermaeus]|nr:hypothetical protein EV401DRAFT_2069185 [Pisolithus croceorrhizus]KAI6150020.1 hypothetical protein EDD17DRAFT_1766101 [Pisolithus thermaeus]